MSSWRDCAVTLIDVASIRKLAEQPNTRASELMRKLHKMVFDEAGSRLPAHAHVYIWNDSVLLLAFLDSASPEAVLREVDGLKRKIDDLAKCFGLGQSYAIAVQGQPFPEIELGQGDVRQAGALQSPRVTIIKASSYAMANCFLIEKYFKNMKKPWYVDSRLAKSLRTDAVATKKEKVPLLPGTRARQVYVYSGYLWTPRAVNSQIGKH